VIVERDDALSKNAEVELSGTDLRKKQQGERRVDDCLKTPVMPAAGVERAEPEEAFLLRLAGTPLAEMKSDVGIFGERRAAGGASGSISDGGCGGGGGGGGGGGTSGKLQKLVVPWQAASRRQFLYLVADIFAKLGNEVQIPSSGASEEVKAAALAAQLSYQLASVQLFDFVLSGMDAAGAGFSEAQAQAGGAGDDEVRQSMHSSMDSADSWPPDAEVLRTEASIVLQKARDTSKSLQEMVKNLRDGEGDCSFALPNPWQAGHATALVWAEEAAAEELLGNYSASETLYARSGLILHFLAVEARADLMCCAPCPAVAAEDEPQLRRCITATASRWAACADALMSQQM